MVNTDYFPFLFQITTHSPSLWKASRSNPCPIFSNSTQNDVTSVSVCLTTFYKKSIVYYWHSNSWFQAMLNINSRSSVWSVLVLDDFSQIKGLGIWFIWHFTFDLENYQNSTSILFKRDLKINTIFVFQWFIVQLVN